MSEEAAANSATDTGVRPDDLLAEGARVRKLSGQPDGVKGIVEGVRLVNDAIFAQVLFALWDSGFYDFSLTHSHFSMEDAARELRLDATVLSALFDYLIGRGFLESAEGGLRLTKYGQNLSNLLVRGTTNLYVGGWGPLLSNLGPLLRNEMPLAEFNSRRSARHTVLATEQFSSIRAAPAVSQALMRRNAAGVLHLACRTGEFMIALARLQPSLHGVGVDRDPARISAAQGKALSHGLQSRLSFVTAEIGRDALPPESALGKFDVVLAIYLLHEVARFGRHKVLELLSHIKATFPGRMFLFMETLPYSPPPPGQKPAASYPQLDYLMIHRIRRQGLPLPPEDWKAVLKEAGLNLLEANEIYGTALYLAEL